MGKEQARMQKKSRSRKKYISSRRQDMLFSIYEETQPGVTTQCLHGCCHSLHHWAAFELRSFRCMLCKEACFFSDTGAVQSHQGHVHVHIFCLGQLVVTAAFFHRTSQAR